MGDGVVHAINVSNGGVPKRPRDAAAVNANGLEGDWQEDRRYHGGPARAVCLYSLDLIEALQAEGHPIAPGTAGENLTLSGLDWTAMTPGTRVEVGDVLLEITSYTVPCRNIAGSFAGGAYPRISQKVRPGWSRVYARVLAPGTVCVGDRVTIGTRSSP